MKIKIIKESKQINEVEEGLPRAPFKIRQAVELINQLDSAKKAHVIEAIGGVTSEKYENMEARYEFLYKAWKSRWRDPTESPGEAAEKWAAAKADPRYQAPDGSHPGRSDIEARMKSGVGR
jgi:hypothetical protein